MAGGKMTGFLFHQRGDGLEAERPLCVRAAGVERASGRRRKGGREVSLQNNTLFPSSRDNLRNRRKKGFRIRMEKTGEYSISLSCLDDFAEIHDGNAVAHVADNRQVMGNEQEGEGVFPL